MLTIGSIINSNSQGEFLSRETVDKLRDTFTRNELFNIAWSGVINPWLQSAYATLNLKTGEIEAHDEFSMRRETPYLILYKVELESLEPEYILTYHELGEFEMCGQLLEHFCELYAINVKQRVKNYYHSYWNEISWYFDSFIEENLFELYETHKVTQYAEMQICLEEEQ